jgi:DNA-binding transcriptional MerR regulator
MAFETTASDVPLQTAEAAQLFSLLSKRSVTPATVRSWERSGRLRAMKTASGVRLFMRADIEALAAADAAERKQRSSIGPCDDRDAA